MYIYMLILSDSDWTDWNKAGYIWLDPHETSISSPICQGACVTARHGAKPVPMPAMITGLVASFKNG